jgi:hypothetical protein
VPGQPLDPLVDAARAQLAEPALPDHPADLQQAVRRRADDREVAAAEVAAQPRLAGHEARQRQLAPDHVHLGAIAMHSRVELAPHQRCAPVGTDHEIGAELALALGARNAHSTHPPGRAEQPARARAALEREARKVRGLAHEQLEQARLRDPGGGSAQLLGIEIHAEQLASAQERARPAQHHLRHAPHRFRQPHLRERIEGAGHQDLAAKLALEVALALEQHHLQATPREQVGQRRPRRPRSNDRNPGLFPGVHSCSHWAMYDLLIANGERTSPLSQESLWSHKKPRESSDLSGA